MKHCTVKLALLSALLAIAGNAQTLDLALPCTHLEGSVVYSSGAFNTYSPPEQGDMLQLELPSHSTDVAKLTFKGTNEPTIFMDSPLLISRLIPNPVHTNQLYACTLVSQSTQGDWRVTLNILFFTKHPDTNTHARILITGENEFLHSILEAQCDCK